MAETSENSQNSQNSAVNYNDPYFLSSGDNPRQQLGTMLFNGDNFINWSRGVKLALGAKNKLCFIDGTLAKPASDSPDLQKWVLNDYMVMSWLTSSMEQVISDSFIFSASARDLWLEVSERFGKSNAPLLYELHTSLNKIEQDNLSIAEYYGRLKNVWDKLQVLEDHLVCSCGALNRCSCDLIKKVHDAQETKKLIQFICGLNKCYDSVKTNLLSMEPLPTVLRAYHILQQIEKQNQINTVANRIPELSALHIQKQFQPMQGSRSQFVQKKDFKKVKADIFCDHCKKRGHSIHQCFKLVGYPEWFTTQKGKQQQPGLVANVSDASGILGSSPLDIQGTPENSHIQGLQIDKNMVSAVYKEVLKMMQQSSDSPTQQFSNVNFADFDDDDLLPGFGSSSPNNRSIPESNQASKPSFNSNQTSKVMDDPFVVLESTSAPGVSSPGFSSDPLNEISKLNNSGTSKENKSSVSTGAFDDMDPFNDFGISMLAPSFRVKNTEKDRSPSKVRSAMKKTRESTNTAAFGGPTFKTHSEGSSQKNLPVDNDHESQQTLFGMPAASTDSQKIFDQCASSPSYRNASLDESNFQANVSLKTERHSNPSDDVWLTVSEIPLFTQPTKAPPPSRPPSPIPRHTSKSERVFSASNARQKNNDFSPTNSVQYSQSQNPYRSAPKNPMFSSVDELEQFSMAKNYNNFNENIDVHSGDDSSTNSAAASVAAMKDAMDHAEAKFRHAKELRDREHAKAARSKESVQLEKDEQEIPDDEIRENQERLNRERQQREQEEEEREHRRLERERAREIEREKARQDVERAIREARERAAAEARERAAADARVKSERAAVQRAQAEARERAATEARERAERAAAEARERATAEAREKEAKEKAAVARAESEARRRAERAAVDRVAAAARERAAAEARDRAAATAAARTSQQKNDNDLESFFNMGSRPSSVPRPRTSSSDPSLDPQFQNRGGADGMRRSFQSGVSSNMKKASSTTNIIDDLSSIFGAAPSNGDFQDVEGETEERRRARLERHQRTQERAAKALAEKNQRDLQVQKDQEERNRVAETLDIEIRRWAAGKEGNLRALLSTLQYMLWPECGWQPVSLTDLITGASVKKVYRKATLCIHPDKVQQKGANLQQKYIAEKVYDLLKEAWDKFSSEELF